MKSHSADPIPIEIELKLTLPSGSGPLIEASSPLTGAKCYRQHLITTYYDTPQRLLYKSGLTMRVRYDGSCYIQTVKSLSNGRGLALTRAEWEWPIDQREPAVELLYEIPQLFRIAQIIHGKVRAQFVTDIHRKTWLLKLPHKTAVEVAIDEGLVRAGRLSAPIAELELELKGGRIVHLYDLAARLQAQAPARISSASKSSRGWQLRYGQEVAPELLKRMEIHSNARGTEAFREIMETQLSHLIANIDLAVRGEAEGVHQMRIALRGLRATLYLFRPYLASSQPARFSKTLQGLGRILGHARDWDVFCGETLPEAEKELASQRLDQLGPAASAEQAKAYEAMTAALLAKPFTAVVLEIATWVAAMQWEAPRLRRGHMGDPISTIAPAMLDRVAHRARKRGKNAEKLSKNELHSFRKALDMLCDDATCLSNIYSQRAVKAYKRPCESLQALLGTANDCAETERLVNKLIMLGPKSLQRPGAALVIRAKQKRHAVLHDLGTVAKKFQAADRFWR